VFAEPTTGAVVGFDGDNDVAVPGAVARRSPASASAVAPVGATAAVGGGDGGDGGNDVGGGDVDGATGDEGVGFDAGGSDDGFDAGGTVLPSRVTDRLPRERGAEVSGLGCSVT
jgi:hypothetical protein